MADTVWHRIDEELKRRAQLRQVPGSWADLGRSIGASAQRLTNWKTRGVPPKDYPLIADAFSWSVDRLLGTSAAPAAPLTPPPPPADFHDRRMVSDSDWQVLQDVRLVLSDDELAKVRERAERTRRIAREQLDFVSRGGTDGREGNPSDNTPKKRR